MTKEIELTQGRVARVDDEDFDWLNQWKWCLSKLYNGKKQYATRGKCGGSKTKTLLMHRLIINAKKDEHVDHRNGDGLDNRRSNLRICTMSQNQANRGPTKANTSGFKGVSPDRRGRWRARVKVNGKQKALGSFATPEEAAIAYDREARAVFGEFARLNFPLPSGD